jgi:diguanylate cyclase (GGDEF) domain
VIRATSWPRAFVVASVVAAFGVTLFAAEIVFQGGGAHTTMAFDDVGTFVAAAVASLACAWSAWRQPHGSRRPWVLLAAYVLFWAIGEATWGYYELIAGRAAPFPSLADVGYLGAVPFGVLAILSFGAARWTRVSRVRTVLDGSIIAGCLLFVSWAFVLGPVVDANAGGLVSQVLSLAYPLSDLVIGSIALAVLARSEPGARGPLTLITMGILAMTVADGVYAYLVQSGSYDTTNVIDAIWITGYSLLALAAVRAVTSFAQPARVETRTPLTRILVPYVALGAAGATAVVVEVTHGQEGPFLFWVGLGVVVLVGCRQLLAFSENRSLNNQLASTVDSLRQREDDLEYLAFHDPLTGLANRALFRDRIDHAIARAARAGGTTAIVFIDLDDFKTVNDTLGHAAGDEVLVSFAARVRSCIRPGDTIARLGGDEFGVLLDGCSNAEADAGGFAQRLLNAARESYTVAGHQLNVTASMGISSDSLGAHDAESLLRNADLALYEAKTGGKDRHMLYHASMGSDVLERLELRAALQEGIDHDQFRLVYQPIVRLDTEALVGYEALVRWHHPIHGVLDPGMFLPLAEQSGLILPIGRSVLLQACTQVRAWAENEPELGQLDLHINLSAWELQDDALVADVVALLEATGADPSAIVLEITESAMIDDERLALDHLNALKALGFRIGLDDFGTGYSSLSYLQEFPIDVLKIDRSFVAHIDTGANGEPLLAAIIQLGHTLGIRTIAEGVETPAQRDRLRDLGCDCAQGFLFGRPLPAGAASASQPRRESERPRIPTG